MEEFKYLGLWFDSHLSFRPHIDSIVKKNHSSLNEIRQKETFQSGFRDNHSTESAVVEVFSDHLISSGNRFISTLTLLDLSAASDTIDHDRHGCSDA